MPIRIDHQKSHALPVVIAGAGLAGISCAFHLKKPSFIFEREKHVGGTARSYHVKGFTFDFTGHLLHLHNDYTRKLIRRLLKGNFYECKRNAWIYSNKVYTRYPFQANLYGLPHKVIEECILGLWKVRNEKKSEIPSSLDFQTWCEQLFGKGISKNFMIPYNQKLWGVPPSEMTAQWCGEFVPQPQLEDVLSGALQDQTKAFGYNTTFLYPKKGGIQILPETMAHHLKNINLGVSLDKIFWEKRTVCLSTKSETPYSHFVSTLPLPELLKRLEPFPQELIPAYKKLRWTSVLCVNLGVDRANISDKSWVYFPEKKFPFYRVGFPMNFTPHAVPKGCSSMYVEVSYPPQRNAHDSNWQKEIYRKIKTGLITSGILKKTDKIPVVSFAPIKYAYVIYDKNRNESVDYIMEWLNSHSIYSIGRYGAWKYSFMEAAILDGKEVADRINHEI